MATVDTERSPISVPHVETRRRATLWRWLGWGTGGLLVVVLLLVGSGAAYQSITTANDQRRFPPPGQLVDVGSFQFRLYCLGKAAAGSPTVIFDAGAGRRSIDWRLIQPVISQTTRACVYDRAGLGWSEASPHPRTSRQMMAELHTLLQNVTTSLLTTRRW
jgi:pimeloyl-ACP methyl ester carboxylesterase